MPYSYVYAPMTEDWAAKMKVLLLVEDAHRAFDIRVPLLSEADHLALQLLRMQRMSARSEYALFYFDALEAEILSRRR